MKSSLTNQGGNKLLQRLREQPQLINRSLESVLRQEGRALCVEYSKATFPGPGFDAAKTEQFKKRVEGDVRRVFAVRSQPGQIFALIKIHAPELAPAYWHAVKSQKPRQAEEILRKANLPTGLSPADHKAARTGKKSRVGKLVSPASLATEPQLNAFVRKQLALVEFAKAGWAAAAKAIGGRVRANVRVPGQKRTTREVFPASIRKLVNRYSSIGSASYSISGSTHSLTIATHVKHAQEATNPGMMASAESRAQDSFTRAIAQSLQALHRRLRRAA